MKTLKQYINEAYNRITSYEGVKLTPQDITYINDREGYKKPSIKWEDVPYYMWKPSDKKAVKTITVDGEKKKLKYIQKNLSRHQITGAFNKGNDVVSEYNIIIDGKDVGKVYWLTNIYFDGKIFDNEKQLMEYAYKKSLK